MTRIDQVIRELGQLHDFATELANYRLAMVGDQKMEQRKSMEKEGGSGVVQGDIGYSQTLCKD